MRELQKRLVWAGIAIAIFLLAYLIATRILLRPSQSSPASMRLDGIHLSLSTVPATHSV